MRQGELFKLSSLECSEAAGWVTGRASDPIKLAPVTPKVLFLGCRATVVKKAVRVTT